MRAPLKTASAIALYAAAHPKAWATLKLVFESADLPLIRFDLAMRRPVGASNFAIS